MRLGICYYLLGRYRLAVDALSTADGGALAQFYLGKSHFARQDYKPAVDAYQLAARGGYDANACTLAKGEALRYQGLKKEALAAPERLSSAAEYLYQRGATVAAMGGNPAEAVALLERAVEVDPKHPGALFALALENDRRGNDETAL